MGVMRGGAYAERTRMALGAGAFFFMALILPAVWLLRGWPPWLLGAWGVAGAAVLFFDRRLKRDAARGTVGSAAWGSGATLLTVGALTAFVDGGRTWVTGAGALIAASALAGLGLAVAARFATGRRR